MNYTLQRFCFALWILGFAGMWATKGLPFLGELPFEICVRLTLIGGLSACFLVSLDALTRGRHTT